MWCWENIEMSICRVLWSFVEICRCWAICSIQDGCVWDVKNGLRYPAGVVSGCLVPSAWHPTSNWLRLDTLRCGTGCVYNCTTVHCCCCGRRLWLMVAASLFSESRRHTQRERGWWVADSTAAGGWWLAAGEAGHWCQHQCSVRYQWGRTSQSTHSDCHSSDRQPVTSARVSDQSRAQPHTCRHVPACDGRGPAVLWTQVQVQVCLQS